MNDEVRKSLIDLIAIERDRLLGYPEDELHTDPRIALEDALVTLDAHGVNVDEIVFPDDQATLDLDVGDSDE